MNLKVSFNYYDLGGTFRSQDPQKTLAQIEPILQKIGITRIANITGLDEIGIAVTTCMRPNAKHLSVSQGKGLNYDLAKISAVMESIEGYHAENPPAVAFTMSYNQAKNLQKKVVSPHSFNQGILQKQDLENYPLAWVEASHLITGEMWYIPHILICIDSTIDRPEYAFINVSSNGLAAGNIRNEALCHALFELIERDSLYHWQQLSNKSKSLTLINISTIEDDINTALIKKITAANLGIKIWNITTKQGVPAFHCSITDTNIWRGLKFFTGTGAHLSKSIALSRAITEAAQGRLTYISGNRDDVFIDYYQHDHDMTAQENTTGVLPYDAISSLPFKSSFADNVKQLSQLLIQQGHNNIFYVNHTKPEINIPVVHVFVPGLKFNGRRM